MTGGAGWKVSPALDVPHELIEGLIFDGLLALRHTAPDASRPFMPTSNSACARCSNVRGRWTLAGAKCWLRRARSTSPAPCATARAGRLRPGADARPGDSAAAQQQAREPSLALLRVQHEALLRAAWLAHAAAGRRDRPALAAPQTDEAQKQANQLPPARVLLRQIEARTRPMRSSKACGSSVISPGPAPTPTPTPVCCPSDMWAPATTSACWGRRCKPQCPWLRGLHDLGQIPRQRDGPPQHQPGRDHPCRLHGVALGA